MNRTEHLQWCKDRALEYVENNDNQQAFTSFMSDMSKHTETSNHLTLENGMMLLMGGHLSSNHQMREWINGFN